MRNDQNKFMIQMQALIARSFIKPQFRQLYNSTRRCLAQLSATRNAAQKVYKNEDECLVIKWNDGMVDEYPYVYLREHCRCSACWKDEKRSRTMYTPKDVDLDIAAESANWNTENDQLEVKWGDGHTSNYSFEWLKHLRYHPLGEGQPSGVIRKGIKLWGEEMSEEENLPTFQFDKLLNDDEELYRWIVALATQSGIAKVENAPKKAGQLMVLGERVGYLVRTSYGLILQIKAFKGMHEAGYSFSHLNIHSDLTYMHFPSGVAMLHCIQQTKGEGGVNLWVDGFHAAKLLYEEDPESFQILVNTPVVYRSVSKSFEQICNLTRHPLIRVDREKKVKQVCYSDEFRDSHMPLEPKHMKSFYKAYFRYSELMTDKRASFWYKMKSGDNITVNNHRVLHARSEYQDEGDNVRFVEIGYLDWDCVHSKIRILADKQGVQTPVG